MRSAHRAWRWIGAGVVFAVTAATLVIQCRREASYEPLVPAGMTSEDLVDVDSTPSVSPDAAGRASAPIVSSDDPHEVSEDAQGWIWVTLAGQVVDSAGRAPTGRTKVGLRLDLGTRIYDLPAEVQPSGEFQVRFSVDPTRVAIDPKHPLQIFREFSRLSISNDSCVALDLSLSDLLISAFVGGSHVQLAPIELSCESFILGTFVGPEGENIEGAEVLLLSSLHMDASLAALSRTSSDSSGTFRIQIPPSAKSPFLVVGLAHGLRPFVERVDLDSPGRAYLGQCLLDRGFCISGTMETEVAKDQRYSRLMVYRSQPLGPWSIESGFSKGGDPPKRRAVFGVLDGRAEWESVSTTITDDGSFTICGLEDVAYWLVLSDPRILDGLTSRVEVVAPAENVVIHDGAPRLLVRAVDGENGVVLEHAIIESRSPFLPPLSVGQMGAILVLRPGQTYDLRVSATGYIDKWLDPLVLSPGEAKVLSVVLEPADPRIGGIKVFLRDSEGQPIQYVEWVVTRVGSEGADRTALRTFAEDGGHVIDGLAPGEYDFVADPSIRENSYGSVYCPEMFRTEIDVEETREIARTMSAGWRLSIMVTDSKNDMVTAKCELIDARGSALPDVFFLGPDGGVRIGTASDRGPSRSLSAIKPGTYTLRVLWGGHEPHQETIEGVAGGWVERKIRLKVQ